MTQDALARGIAAVRVGGRVSDIGHAVQQHVEAHGYSVVREFVGHGIGAALHEEPQVPNYGPAGRGPRLAEGMVLAIEPMVNMGKPAVKVLADGWTAVTVDGSLSAHFEHSVAVTSAGPWILTALPAAAPAGVGRRRPSSGPERRHERRTGRPRRQRGRRGRGRASRRSCRPRSTGCGWRTAGRAAGRARQPGAAHGTVTAHLSADPRRNFVRILVGERVRVRLSPRDLTRGAIVARLGPGRSEPWPSQASVRVS